MQENNSFTLNGFCSIIYFMGYFCAAELVAHVQFAFWLCLITVWGCINAASKCGSVMSFLWKGGMVPNCQLEQGGPCCTRRWLFSIPADQQKEFSTLQIQGARCFLICFMSYYIKFNVELPKNKSCLP